MKNPIARTTEVKKLKEMLIAHKETPVERMSGGVVDP